MGPWSLHMGLSFPNVKTLGLCIREKLKLLLNLSYFSPRRDQLRESAAVSSSPIPLFVFVVRIPSQLL